MEKKGQIWVAEIFWEGQMNWEEQGRDWESEWKNDTGETDI